MARSQRGHIYKQNGYWYIRFRKNEVRPNGEIVRRQRALRLERVSREFPSKKSLEQRREEVLRGRRVNSPEYNPQSTMTISRSCPATSFQFTWHGSSRPFDSHTSATGEST